MPEPFAGTVARQYLAFSASASGSISCTRAARSASGGCVLKYLLRSSQPECRSPRTTGAMAGSKQARERKSKPMASASNSCSCDIGNYELVQLRHRQLHQKINELARAPRSEGVDLQTQAQVEEKNATDVHEVFPKCLHTVSGYSMRDFMRKNYRQFVCCVSNCEDSCIHHDFASRQTHCVHLRVIHHGYFPIPVLSVFPETTNDAIRHTGNHNTQLMIGPE
eukprot:CAMPEP_0175880824 /NCGR_PEP_ID=MMETSP0107_2-20121207/42541_1 /TAXON_ID=195067 ORGANISM="Goniomonas pacifica, Strain CCMP1869" /NCGR_SAMPLE_ID=MMETSP0107_2 /ASSEMBLY_ACC=CAM_ASM_000203 /LENGTH=221 /DNA_ID=CAMNT_0017200629 /DNA_START=92 /DNA_END=754 /DNA_ORIENTATION=+